MGQETLMPQSHRRAGFRVSIGVIASADVAVEPTPDPNERLTALIAADEATAVAVEPAGYDRVAIPVESATPSPTEVPRTP
jgi:hypothetical protein